VWSFIKDQLNKLNPKPSTLADLELTVLRLWYSISVEYVRKLYASMPHVYSLKENPSSTECTLTLTVKYNVCIIILLWFTH
jgi:hypothetical protein